MKQNEQSLSEAPQYNTKQKGNCRIMCLMIYNTRFYYEYVTSVGHERNSGSAPQKLWPRCWWRCSMCYGSTGPQRNDSLDCNQRIRRPPLCCFLFFNHISPLRFFSLLCKAFGVNRVSSLIDSWRRLFISWYPCLSHSCHFCRRPWIPPPSVNYYFPCFPVEVRRRCSFFCRVQAWKRGFIR